jgi:hypothetical protein
MRGQASIEYVAVVALVALALGGAVALTSGGLGGRVAWALRAALCRVAGGPCPAPPRFRADLPPCPLRDHRRVQGATVLVDFVHLGRSYGLRVVTYSDGHVEVSFTGSANGGFDVGLSAGVDLGALRAGVGASAGVDWRVTDGQSWGFRDAAAARRFVARFAARQSLAGHALHVLHSACFFCKWVGLEAARLPPADSTWYERAAGVTLSGRALALWGVDASTALDRRLLGLRVDRRGGRAVYLRTENSARATAVLGGAAAEWELAATGTVELDFGRSGRPRAIVLRGVRTRVAGTGAAGDDLARTAAAPGTVSQYEVRLADPTRADVRAATALVAGPRAGAAALAALPAFVAHLRRLGTTTVQAYHVRATHGDLGGELKLGIAGAGLTIAHDGADLRLLGETMRLPGLPALPRDDCLVAAGR